MPQRRYLEPSWMISRVVNPLLRWLGVVPTLRVCGRKTGHWRNVPVNVLDLNGEHYLVAPRGETDWVRNLRAAGSGQLRYGRRSTETFRSVEVPDKEKPRVIERPTWIGGKIRSGASSRPCPIRPITLFFGLNTLRLETRRGTPQARCSPAKFYSGQTPLLYSRNTKGFSGASHRRVCRKRCSYL